MRKALNAFFILILLTCPLEANAAGFGAITKFLKGIGKTFKKGADEMPDIGKQLKISKAETQILVVKLKRQLTRPQK